MARAKRRRWQRRHRSPWVDARPHPPPARVVPRARPGAQRSRGSLGHVLPPPRALDAACSMLAGRRPLPRCLLDGAPLRETTRVRGFHSGAGREVGELASLRICVTKKGGKTLWLCRQWVVAWVVPPGHHIVEHSDLRPGNDKPVPASPINLAGRISVRPVSYQG